MIRPSIAGALAAAATLIAGAVVLTVSGTANAATGTPLPAHVFAPYFEAYNGDNAATLSSQSGAKYLTMAFIQTASAGSCTVDWNGDTSMPISSAQFGSQINTIRAAGGDVVPSFGGFAADDTGTEIADSCTSVASIAAQYENVITTYNVSRIDLDTEDNSLTNTAGIDRRNKAIKMVEDWAATQGRTIQFVYTLPTTTSGLESSGLAVLQNAVSNNAAIAIVNIMTFDYYDNATHNMANDTETAANGLHSQLQTLYPSKSSTQIWNMIGVTEMPGIDDFGAAETFTTANAPTVESWAVSKGIAEISFWALQRDNGNCPGTGAQDNCSGVSQSTWQFSHVWEPFTSGGTTTSPSPSTSPSHSASPSPSPSHSATPTPTPDAEQHADASPGRHRGQRRLRERRAVAVDVHGRHRQRRHDTGALRYARVEGGRDQFRRRPVHGDDHGGAEPRVHAVGLGRRSVRVHRNHGRGERQQHVGVVHELLEAVAGVHQRRGHDVEDLCARLVRPGHRLF